MDKRFLAVLVVIIVALGGVYFFSTKNNKTPATSAQPTNHVTGEGKKGITLVEYGDYQCPICEKYFPVVKQVTTQFSSDIYFQFRNLPLSSIHQNAFAAARAAEAAAKQNKFWEMNDVLYDSQNWQTWTNASSPQTYFNVYAQQLGLNVSQFQTDYASSAVNDAINADLTAFQKTKQPEATPTFFLDGKYISNSDLADNSGPSATKFTSVINAAIAAKK
jgi:protein-disulfide isomerase